MGLNAKNKAYNGGKKVVVDPVEPGTYPARVVQVIDLGTQPQPAWKGEEKPPAQEISVTYELVDEFIKDENGEDKPRWISERFTLHNLSSELAKSTKRYFAIDPKAVHDGDWTKLIGMPVMVTIVVNPGKGDKADRMFEKIASTSTAREKEAAKMPPLSKEGKVFTPDDASTADILGTLPKWLQEKITSGLDYEGSAVYLKLNSKVGKPAKEKPVEEDDDDDLPEIGGDKDEEEDW